MQAPSHTLSITKQPRHHYSSIGSPAGFEDLYAAEITDTSGQIVDTFYYLARPGDTHALHAKLSQRGYATPLELLPRTVKTTYDLHAISPMQTEQKQS